MSRLKNPLDGLIIQHPIFMNALNLVNEVENRTEAGERLIVSIFGPTRVGKNSCVALLRQSHALHLEGHKTMRPSILVKIPPKPTLRSMPDAVLAALGQSALAIRGNKDARTDRAVRLLTLSGTRYIIFDEIQHLFEEGRRKQDRDVSDWIKNLAEEAQVTIIMLGMPLGAYILEVNEQLRDRALSAHYILPYDWTDRTERVDFIGAINSVLEEVSQAGYTINIAEDLTVPLYLSTAGRIGMLVKLINDTCQLAADSGILTVDLLKKSHDRAVSRQTQPFNPFERTAWSDDQAADAYWGVLKQSGCTAQMVNDMRNRATATSAPQDHALISHRSHQVRADKRRLGC